MSMCLHSSHVTDYPNCRKAKVINTITDLHSFFWAPLLVCVEVSKRILVLTEL